jgi:arginyl-tRNA synthetase
MYTAQEAKVQTLTMLKSALGKSYVPTVNDLESPPNPEMGDLAFPCFELAKKEKTNPAELAKKLAKKIKAKGLIEKVGSQGPYVNFFFDPNKFGQALLKEVMVAKDKFGASTVGNGTKIMVEYAAPNTLKEIHVGHLRNFVLGNSVINVLRTAGYNVVAASYINDLGSHIAKTLWAIDKYHKDEGPKPEERDAFLSSAYVEACAKEEKNKKAKNEISNVYRALEDGDRKWQPLWKKTRKWSLDYIFGIFKELGLQKDVQYYESELTKRSHKIVDKLIKDGLAKESEGAIIVNLEDQDLRVNLLKRSDGTLLYNGKDLALAERKENDYQPDRSIYVIDARQSLAMQQLFATLKLMGFEKNLTHLSYEFVTLKGGAMASRKGNVVRYEDFRDKMIAMARAETEKRHEDWSDKQLDSVAKVIAFAAMKFPMLRQDLDKMIVFDMKEALSFEGFSGPYILYTITRAKSILKKSKIKPKVTDQPFSEPLERQLFAKLSEYPEVVLRIASTNQISALPQYLFDLAQLFSSYYEAVPVLKAESDKIVAARLATVGAVRQVLENGMGLLGIETLDEM